MSSPYITHETGIYEYTDRNRKEPFLWRQTINGKKFSESYDTLKKAQKAKRSMWANVKKYGKLATQFDQKDWRMFAEAADILPNGVSVLDAARYYVDRFGDGKGKSVDSCFKEFIEHQTSRGNGYDHIRTLKTRVGYLANEDRLGLMGVREISGKMVLELLKELTQTLAPRTVKNYRNDWFNFFEFFMGSEIHENPVAQVNSRHLPKVKATTKKNPLEVHQVAAIMALAEERFPDRAMWLALQFFLGFREGEASRFRFEWINPKMKRVVIPGWDEVDGERIQGSKTEDAWALDDVPGNFWYWFDKYGEGEGPVGAPASWWDWFNCIRTPILDARILDEWPVNAKRDSFCTYHISAFRNTEKTALMLKHRSVNTLWQSYMGCLRPEDEGMAYFQIYPGCELIVNNN